jgi:hypothetical protein
MSILFNTSELSVSNVADIPSPLLFLVGSIQEQLGNTLPSLHRILDELNNYCRGDNLVLANVYFKDFINEAVRNGEVIDANCNVSDAIDRFFVIKEIASIYEDTKNAIESATGVNVQFKNPNYSVQIPNDAELAIKVGINLRNIAELTAWAFLEENDTFTGKLISTDNTSLFASAVSNLKAVNQLIISECTLKDYTVSVVHTDDDAYQLNVSNTIRRLVSLHMANEIA